MKPRVIAFYLPQFHPVKENSEWYGEGFTEWTNVGKAKPLFWGHKQPKVPTNLGYYDLRIPEVREKQVELAKQAGVEGFCYWHYWFANGKQLLEKPLEEVVRLGKPDFPFCLGWANESWYKKLWNKDAKGDSLLIEQVYGGHEDYLNHFNTMLPMFNDKRYIKVDGKLLFMIYNPHLLPDSADFISYWQQLAKENGLPGFHFVAHAGYLDTQKEYNKYIEQGYDAIYTNRVQTGARVKQKNLFLSFYYIALKILRLPRIVSFNRIINGAVDPLDKKEYMYPGIICNWDHTPRSKKNGMLFVGFNKEKFKKHIRLIFDEILEKPDEKKIVFLKSWNEWAEGNFMEPDIEFGMDKIEALSEVIKEYK